MPKLWHGCMQWHAQMIFLEPQYLNQTVCTNEMPKPFSEIQDVHLVLSTWGDPWFVRLGFSLQDDLGIDGWIFVPLPYPSAGTITGPCTLMNEYLGTSTHTNWNMYRERERERERERQAHTCSPSEMCRHSMHDTLCGMQGNLQGYWSDVASKLSTPSAMNETEPGLGNSTQSYAGLTTTHASFDKLKSQCSKAFS